MTATSRTSAWALRLLAVAGLAVDTYVHLDLRAVYARNGDDITQGHLFVAAAVTAIAAGLLLLASDRRIVWAVAGMTAGSALAAVLVYRYVQVGAIGPVPDMYEPVWYDKKTLSAVAEAVVVLAWLAREALRLSQSRRTDASRPGPVTAAIRY